MEFEELVVRPTAGPCDAAAIVAWLEARPFAFLDPVDGRVWHLSATPQTAARRRQERLGDPRRWPLGVLVLVLPESLVLGATATEDDLARAVELLTWLGGHGTWTVTPDAGPPSPLGDPRSLFPPSVPDSLLLDHDATLEAPVAEGRLLTWTDNTRPGRELVAHTGGTWRYRSGDRVLRGRLEVAAGAALAAAVAALDGDAPWPREGEDAPVTLELEDAEGLEYFHLDLGSPPARCAALAALVGGWLAALERWQPGGALDGLVDVRESR